MPDIKTMQSTAADRAIRERTEKNTANLEDWLRLTVNEIRRLRIGDTTPGDEDVL